MEEEKIFCKECCKEISLEEAKQYKGFCKNCYGERENKSNEEEEEDIITNKIASSIKTIGFILLLVGIFAGLGIGASQESLLNGFLIIVGTIVTTIFIFGFGEIIQLLEDIKNK